MIKTFLDTDAERLDRGVNDFMVQYGRDLPVRTETFTAVDGLLFHKAVVFFDMLKNGQSSPLPNGPPQRVKVGAAWKNTKIAGMLNVKFDKIEGYHYVDQKDQRVQEDGSIIVETAKGTFLFLESVKQKVTSPDYTVYRVGVE